MPFQKPSTTTRARNSRFRMLIRAWGSMSEREERFWSGEITIKHPTSNIQQPEKFDEDPRSKIQDPEKIQYPISKPDQRHGRRAIQHACSPGKQICLDLGSWILDLCVHCMGALIISINLPITFSTFTPSASAR